MLGIDRVAFNMRVMRGAVPVALYDGAERPLFDRSTIEALAIAESIKRASKAAKEKNVKKKHKEKGTKKSKKKDK